MTSYKKKGLARLSLFLGFISLFLMLGIITAFPGIITGHIARSRAINFPHQYGASRVAMMGLLMSYMSIVVIIVLISVGNYFNTNGDLIPFLDTVDSTNKLSQYAKTLYGTFPFNRL
ncbi:MAG: hypothetical protein V3U84_00980 [Thiotrichaceae bacterium]